MSKIIVAYWSQTGNTEAMANAVGEGIKAAGGEADVVPVSAVSVDELKAASSDLCIFLRCFQEIDHLNEVFFFLF